VLFAVLKATFAIRLLSLENGAMELETDHIYIEEKI